MSTHHPAEAEFRCLVSEHRERLFRFVLRRVGHADEAEDLAQQAFVEAAAGYAGFHGGSQLSTWLYGIALNLVRQHLARSPHRAHRFDDDSELDALPCSAPCPARQYELKQWVQALDVELQALLPAMREALLLVALDELSYDAAALQLALPVGTVRSRVSRARAQLRRGLAPTRTAQVH